MQSRIRKSFFELGWHNRGLIFLGLVLITGLSMSSASASEFQSRASIDLGRQLNISDLYEVANATYRVEAHDDKQITWALSQSARADKALVASGGEIEVGSSSRFDPAVKERMDKELDEIVGTVNGTLLNNSGKGISREERMHLAGSAVYYSGDNTVDARTWGRCGDILVNKGNYFGSLYYYQRAVEMGPALAEVHNNMGVAMSRLGRSREALEAYDKAINLTASNSTAWNNKGIALYAMGKKDLAMECFNRSIQADQGNSLAWYNKGIVFSEMRRYDDAIECYNLSIQADAYRAEAWNNKGVAQARLGRYEDAKTCFQNAATLNPKYTKTMINGGIVLQRQGESEDANTIFALAKKLGYNNTEDYYTARISPYVLIDEKSKGLPGFGCGAVILGLMGMRLLIAREMGK